MRMGLWCAKIMSRLFSSERGLIMGVNLDGKELGRGLRQRSDKKYSARILLKSGKRAEKVFDRLNDAKRWLSEQRYINEHGSLVFGQVMTLDTWYEYWIKNIKEPTVRITTLKGYERRYNFNIKPVLGNMLLADIKPLHCQEVLNRMDCTQGTQELARVTLQQIFDSAVDNELIERSPVTRTVKVKRTEKKERRVFTAEEQKRFVDYITTTNHRYKRAYLFVLETGLRVGELKGLMWSDLTDTKLTVNRNMVYVDSEIGEIIHEPKTEAGHRIIPLTMKAREIIKECKHQPVVGQYVFTNEVGETLSRSDINDCLRSICKKLGMDTISIHGLRHSFATRCIERGMIPKTLQKILGHSSLNITMDLYVHITDDILEKEMLEMELNA